MNQEVQNVNSIAPLQNVSRCMSTLKRSIDRPGHLPGIISLYGPSGWGKSTAAAYVANYFQAYYVEAKDTWTRKAFLEAILLEMGIAPATTISKQAEQVTEQLAVSGKPLLIDEFDYIVKKNNVDMVRDIYDGSGSAILIIGEEKLETNLRRWERFHNRVLDWVPAEACSLKDSQLLRKLYCDKVNVADDLLNRVMTVCKGNVSRTCINLANIQEYALQKGMSEISLQDWGNQHLFDGAAPKRRV